MAAMMHQSRRLIVGSSGSANSFGTIQSVRDHYGDSVFVVATDTNRRELVAASVLADAFVQVPAARSPEFPQALAEIAASYPDSFYLPVHDDELEAAARLAADGSLPSGLDLIAPPLHIVRLCGDKWAMHGWLGANGLPSPETALATRAAFERLPSGPMLKPREGYGSRSVRLIHAADELATIDSDHWLLQEQLRQPEVGIDVFLSRGVGTFFCVCREYLEKRAGATKARVFHDPALTEIAERIARGLPLFGAFMFQVMRDAASRWRIIDVNPRVGSATRMSAVLGMDFAAANLADYWGEPTGDLMRPLTREHYVVRQYKDYITTRP